VTLLNQAFKYSINFGVILISLSGSIRVIKLSLNLESCTR